MKVYQFVSTKESEEKSQTQGWKNAKKKRYRNCHLQVATLGTDRYTVQVAFTCNVAYLYFFLA